MNYPAEGMEVSSKHKNSGGNGRVPGTDGSPDQNSGGREGPGEAQGCRADVPGSTSDSVVSQFNFWPGHPERVGAELESWDFTFTGRYKSLQLLGDFYKSDTRF